MSNPMKILLIEDDEIICKEFEKTIEGREDAVLSQITNSAEEAIKLVNYYKYDGIIVDLELHFGTGSGFKFLKELKKLKLDPKPIIVVNTNIISEIVYNNIHKGLADMIFYKQQNDYSVESVIDTMVSLRGNKKQEQISEIEKIEEKEKLIEYLINKELDLVGINYRLKGREYMIEAITYLIQNSEEEMTAFQFIANKHGLSNSSIARAIQTAINEAWRTSPVEDLKKYYKAKIDYNTGVPKPTEFTYYYADKIKNITQNN